MNERSTHKSNRSIERALAARWGSPSPDPSFVARLEHSLTAASGSTGRADHANDGVARSFCIPVAGWIAIGVAVVAVVAGTWLGTQSKPPLIETLTATPAITMTIDALSPEALAPSAFIMQPDVATSPTRMPAQPQPVRLSPDPPSMHSETPSVHVARLAPEDTPKTSH